MSLQNLTNLYEVIKTLKFELKPSKSTKERIRFDGIINLHLLENPSELFKQTKELIFLQRIILDIILSCSPKEIVINKNLIKIINSEIFCFLRKQKLSSIITLSEIIKSKSEFINIFYTFIKNLADNIGKNIYKFESYILNIEKVYTKTEIGFAMKQYCYAIQKAHETISSLVYKTGNINSDLKEKLMQYFGIMNLKNNIKLCSQTIKSYSPNIGFEIHKFGLNAKAIRKRVDVDYLQKQSQQLETEMNYLEEQKNQATQVFDSYVKHFNDYVIHGKERDEKTWGKVSNKIIKNDIKLLALKQNQTSSQDDIKKAKEYLKLIKDGNFDYQKIKKSQNKSKKDGKEFVFTSTGDLQYGELKLKKTDLSVQYGKKKGDFFAKQTEFYNQEKLTHYARILRDGEKYFVAMIDRDNISLLETLSENALTGDDFEIMAYNSLTSKAIEKLIFEKNALKFGSDDIEFKTCKSIREKRSYKEKGSTDMQAKTIYEKKDLIRLVNFMNSAVGKINIQLEGGIFDWKPFKITDKFNDFTEFTKYITKTCYVVKRKKILKNKIYQLDKEGKIDFYQIYNKDFAVDPYCAITERDKRSSGTEKKKKSNLFTIYRQQLFENNGENIRLNPESKLYIRPAKTLKELDLKLNDINQASKLRFRENKIIADFQLIFYPTKQEKLENLQKKIYDETKDNSYAIGIDLGENSLATICLIDNNKKVILDENGNPIIKDLTIINNKGEFVDELNCFVGNKKYKRKKLMLEVEGSYYFHNLYFSEIISNKPIKGLSKEELQQAYNEILILSPENLQIVDKDGNKVFDYAYAFMYKKTLNKIIYHLQSIESKETDKKYLELDLLDSTKIRSGYVGKLINFITKLTKKHNAVIIFENLDKKGEINGLTLFSEIRYEKISSKEKNIISGVSVYQNIQNKIIQKCNYILLKDQKDDDELQITPKFKKVEDFKNFTSNNKNKNVGRGAVYFINEENSSKECPNCGFIPGNAGNRKFFKDTIGYSFMGEKINISITDEKIKERSMIFSHIVADEQILNNLTDEQKKYQKSLKSAMFETRVKYANKELFHIEGDPMVCIHCGYDTRNQERVKKYNLKSCDEIAAYTLAKRGLDFLHSGNVLESTKPKEKDDNQIKQDSKTESHQEMKSNINFI